MAPYMNDSRLGVMINLSLLSGRLKNLQYVTVCHLTRFMSACSTTPTYWWVWHQYAWSTCFADAQKGRWCTRIIVSIWVDHNEATPRYQCFITVLKGLSGCWTSCVNMRWVYLIARVTIKLRSFYGGVCALSNRLLGINVWGPQGITTFLPFKIEFELDHNADIFPSRSSCSRRM